MIWPGPNRLAGQDCSHRLVQAAISDHGTRAGPWRLPWERLRNTPVVTPVVFVAFRWFQVVLLGICSFGPFSPKMQKAPISRGFLWSEREDLNLRPLVSQTSALTGLRHAPMPFP